MIKGKGSENVAKQRRNASLPWGLLIFIFIAAFSAMDNFPEEVMVFVVGVLVFWGIVLWLIFLMQKKHKEKAAHQEHSHNRVNQKQDYKINAATGQVVNRQTVRTQHSSYAHWKEQLDSLLENGTILKDEYELLLRQHK